MIMQVLCLLFRQLRKIKAFYVKEGIKWMIGQIINPKFEFIVL